MLKNFMPKQLWTFVITLVVVFSSISVNAGPVPFSDQIRDYLLGMGEQPDGADLNQDGRVDIADLVLALTLVPPDLQVRLEREVSVVEEGHGTAIRIDLLDLAGQLANPGTPGVISGPVTVELSLTGPGVFPESELTTHAVVVDTLEGTYAEVSCDAPGEIELTAEIPRQPHQSEGVFASTSFLVATAVPISGTIMIGGEIATTRTGLRFVDRETGGVVFGRLVNDGAFHFDVVPGIFDVVVAPEQFNETQALPVCEGPVTVEADAEFVFDLPLFPGSSTLSVSDPMANNNAEVNLWYLDGTVCDFDTHYRLMTTAGMAVYENLPPGRAYVTMADFDRFDNQTAQVAAAGREVTIPETGSVNVIVDSQFPVEGILTVPPNLGVSLALPEVPSVTRASNGKVTILFDANIDAGQRPVDIDAIFQIRNQLGDVTELTETIHFTLPPGGPATLEIPHAPIPGDGTEHLFEISVFGASFSETGGQIVFFESLPFIYAIIRTVDGGF